MALRYLRHDAALVLLEGRRGMTRKTTESKPPLGGFAFLTVGVIGLLLGGDGAEVAGTVYGRVTGLTRPCSGP
jgi:hypothetical protein